MKEHISNSIKIIDDMLHNIDILIVIIKHLLK